MRQIRQLRSDLWKETAIRIASSLSSKEGSPKCLDPTLHWCTKVAPTPTNTAKQIHKSSNLRSEYAAYTLTIAISQYLVAHANPQGAGDARPTALQIVKDEVLIGNMAGRVMIITGESAGIGAEIARAFHATGAGIPNGEGSGQGAQSHRPRYVRWQFQHGRKYHGEDGAGSPRVSPSWSKADLCQNRTNRRPCQQRERNGHARRPDKGWARNAIRHLSHRPL